MGMDLSNGGHLMHVIAAKAVALKEALQPGFKAYAEKILDTVHITVNKNTVPNETESPFVTSGIRLGTAALTTRGMKEEEMRVIGQVMADALSNPDDEAVVADCNKRIAALCKAFPLYPEVE